MKNKTLAIVLLPWLTACSVYTTQATPDRNSMVPSRSYYLPKGIATLKIVRENDDDTDLTVSLTPKIVADTGAGLLYLNREHNVLYDDKYVVETDGQGLLKAVNTTSTFKGKDIIESIGKIAAKVVSLKLDSTARSPNCDMKKFSFEIDIDPAQNTANEVNSLLNPPDKQGRCVTIDFPSIANTGVGDNVIGSKAIIYRSSTNFPATINIKSADGKDTLAQKTLTISLPDTANPAKAFKIDRGWFVDRTINLEFTNGVLTKDDSTYPSEVLGFLSLPLALVDGISSAITGRFTTRTTTLENEKKYLDAIKSRNDAKTALTP